MLINFIDLKDFLANSAAGGVSVHDSMSGESGSPGGDRLRLLENAVNGMFGIHSESSSTVWDRGMFDNELKREGSGFVLCYSNDYNPEILPSGKFIPSQVSGISGFTGKSALIGFFIFYTVLDEMHILDITVAKKVQRNGAGSSMLDFVLKKYSSLGIKYFFLEVRVSNKAAINMYKKFGFKVFLLRKKYYDDNGEDALCMVKEL